MFGQKRIKELEGALRDAKMLAEHYEKCFHNYKARCDKLEDQSKELKMSNGVATHSSSNFAKDYDHRVFQNTPESTSDILVVDSRCKTFEEALSLAQKLAAKYPANTYKVVSTVAVVKADIPVVTTQKARFE